MAIATWLRSLFGGKNNKNTENNTSSRHHDSFLASEQRELSERAMRVWKKLEQALDLTAEKMRAAKNNPSAKKRLIQEQQNLHAALLRLETSLKKTQDLQRELTEWRRSSHAKHEKVSLNHPALRQAIIKSELEVRSAMEDGALPLLAQEAEESRGCVAEVQSEQKIQPDVQAAKPEKAYRMVRVKTCEQANVPHDPEGLVKTIRHVSRELALETQKRHKDKGEIVDFLHQLKDLHGALRLVDRANGKLRDRLAITDGFRHVFTHH